MTPTPSARPNNITASLTSIVVCTQEQSTCANDLNPNATSGEQAVVLVLGARGSLVVSNAGGASKAKVLTQVYSGSGTSTEYEVIYTTMTATPTTDTLAITDSSTNAVISIPVKIVSPGFNAGPSAFSLQTTAGTPCPGNQMTFKTQMQGDAAVTLTSSDTSFISVDKGSGEFFLGLRHQGSGTITAAAGSSTVIYPANIPATGFTPTC